MLPRMTPRFRAEMQILLDGDKAEREEAERERLLDEQLEEMIPRMPPRFRKWFRILLDDDKKERAERNRRRW
jgi:hypothetical protein